MKNTFFLLTLPAVIAGFLFLNSHSAAEAKELEIVKFEADWCGPCREMQPIFSRVAREMGKSASFRSVNVDTQSELADRHRVRALPTVIAFKDGREVGRQTGFQSNRKLKSFVRKHQ